MTATMSLLEALGTHHNNRYKIVHTLQSTGNIRRTGLSNNSVNRRRDGGIVSEIRWEFLVPGVGFLLLGAFGRHHNNGRKIVHTRRGIGKMGLSRLLEDSVNRRRDGGVVWEISCAFLGASGFGLHLTCYWEVFGHQHNNRQNIEHARRSTGKIRQTGLSKKKSVNWRRDGGAAMCDNSFF